MTREIYREDALQEIAVAVFIVDASLTGIFDALLPRACAGKSESAPPVISGICSLRSAHEETSFALNRNQCPNLFSPYLLKVGGAPSCAIMKAYWGRVDSTEGGPVELQVEVPPHLVKQAARL